MKKIFILLFMFGVFFGCKIVKAEEFVEGKFISGEYVNKVKNGKTYYMTMQYIEDHQGNIVYCLEPFTDFQSGMTYQKYEGDLTGYQDLNDSQKRKIELLLYYGYGYKNRTSSKWYVITQYLIWKEIDTAAVIYFTDTLNGNRINKYTEEMNAILHDVEVHELKPSFVKEYQISLGEELVLEGVSSFEVMESDFSHTFTNGNLVVSNITESGEIEVKRKSNYYQNKVTIYDSSTSQDLIRPGNVENASYIIPIQVLKGDITLDIRDDHSVYTVESRLTDTCYEIRKDDQVVDRVCTGEDPLVYKTVDLPYGKYEIYQISHGIGYKEDVSVYQVEIDAHDSHPSVLLQNQLIKNTLTVIKYACRQQLCFYEEGALFRIEDKNGDVVSTLSTDSTGTLYAVLGYGTYEVIQVEGLENYSLSSSFRFKIVDEETEHLRKLFNYFIEDEEEAPVEEEEILPPATKVDFSFFAFLLQLLSNICSFLFVML